MRATPRSRHAEPAFVPAAARASFENLLNLLSEEHNRAMDVLESLISSSSARPKEEKRPRHLDDQLVEGEVLQDPSSSRSPRPQDPRYIINVDSIGSFMGSVDDTERNTEEHQSEEVVQQVDPGEATPTRAVSMETRARHSGRKGQGVMGSRNKSWDPPILHAHSEGSVDSIMHMTDPLGVDDDIFGGDGGGSTGATGRPQYSRAQSRRRILGDFSRSATSIGISAGQRTLSWESQESYELYPLWLDEDVAPSTNGSGLSPIRQGARVGTMDLEEIMGKTDSQIRGGDFVQGQNSVLRRLMVSPSSKRKIVWDMLSVIMLAYDVLTVPMIVFNKDAEDDIDSEFKQIADMTTSVFWTLDIGAQFLCGFHRGGFVEMRFEKVAARYARGWLVPDVIVVSLDWSMLLLDSIFADVVGFIRITKILRVFRVFRLFRLFRVLKMPVWATSLRDKLKSEVVLTALGAASSIGSIATLNHFIACGWYFVGTTVENDYHWVRQMEEEGRDVTYRYVTALHWSLSQFTPAGMEVAPTNVYERVYAIIIIFIALVTFSQFISSITTAMATMKRVNAEKSKQRECIQRYLFDNHITLGLSTRIEEFLKNFTHQPPRRVHETDIQVFKLLPEMLRLQLHWEVYKPSVNPHPLFQFINQFDEMLVLDICHEAMGEISRLTNQDLFKPGQKAGQMYFCICGMWEYSRDWSDGHPYTLDANGEEDPWILEVALWCKWEHQGRMRALTQCELKCLSVAEFHRIVHGRPGLRSVCKEYAKEYAALLVDEGFGDTPVEIYNCQNRARAAIHVFNDDKEETALFDDGRSGDFSIFVRQSSRMSRALQLSFFDFRACFCCRRRTTSSRRRRPSPPAMSSPPHSREATREDTVMAVDDPPTC